MNNFLEFYPILKSNFIFEDKYEETEEMKKQKKAGAEALKRLKSKKIEDYGIVYTKDGKAIDMSHLKREMESAKTAIVSQSPLFAPYVHHFVPIYTWLVPTMATDGTRLFVNPEFANELTWEQKIFVLIHEIMHCVLLHMERQKGRDPKLFNIAADYEINAIIIDTIDDFNEDFIKEIKGLYNKQYLNWAVEQIYEEVKKNPPPMPPTPKGNKGSGKGQGGQGGQGNSGGEPGEGEPGEGSGGSGSPGGQGEEIGGAGKGSDSIYEQMGEYDPAGTGGIIPEDLGKKIAKESGYGEDEMGPDENARDKWNVESGKLMNRLNKTQKSGKGKGNSLLTALQKLHKGEVNWKNAFRRYVATALSPETYNKLGNKKHLGREYLKYGEKQKSDAIEHIVVLVDVSGSMSQEVLEKILGEINGIIFAKRVNKITVAFFDDGVDEKSVQVIKKHGGRPWIPKNVSGGGGTSFVKALEWVHDKLKDRISLCVFFTDTYAPMPPKPPYANKFIWVVYDNPGFDEPFGKQINLS